MNTLYSPYSLGGAERSVRELAEELVGHGHTVCVLTLQDDSAGLPEQEIINSVRVERVALNRTWPFGDEWISLSSASKAAWHMREDISSNARDRIRNLVQDFQPNIVNTHNIAGFGTAIWNEFASLPLIHTVRDYYLACLRTTLYRSDHLCVRRCADCTVLTSFRRYRAKLPDVYVGVSQRVLDIHAEAGILPSATPKYVIYNSPTQGDTSKTSSASETFRQKFAFVFGFMGRPEPAKGLPLIMEAMKSPHFSDTGLIIAGAGRSNQSAELEVLAKEYDNIKIVGRIPPEEYLAMIDAALVPTQWEEPFGRVALEAMTVGLPVIASRIGGLPEVLDSYHRAILVDPPSDVRKWSEAMQLVRTDSRNQGVERRSDDLGKSNILDKKVVDEYEAVYRRALSHD